MFLYLLDGVDDRFEGIPRAEVERRGLDVPLRDVLVGDWLPSQKRAAFTKPTQGPRLDSGAVQADGPGGVLVAVRNDVPGCGEPQVKVPEQIWERVETPGGGYWLGNWKEFPPSPETLARDKQLAGQTVVLGDGREWVVPIARSRVVVCELPERMTYRAQPGGPAVVYECVAEWSWLWQLSARVFDYVFGARQATSVELFEWASLILSANYRVGPVEVSRLGLLTTETIQAVFRACVDADRLEQFLNDPEERALLEKMGVLRPKPATPAAAGAESESAPAAVSVPPG